MTSNGNSTREAGQFQLRRRLHNGFTASLQYTYRQIDRRCRAWAGAARATAVIAQNWLDLSAERGLSTFDQRHLVTRSDAVHHRHGHWRRNAAERLAGRAVQRMDVHTQITAGSGLPLTPVYPGGAYGTGVTGSIRPDYTGAPLYAAPRA